MTCTEIDELAGAIALDAIPEAEWPAVQDHLATCPRGHLDIRELRRVAALLLEAAPAVEPPAGLRGRILAAARAEGQAAPPTATPVTSELLPDAAAAPATPQVIRRTDRAWWSRPAWGVAAAAVVLAAAFGIWSISLRRDLNRTEDRLAAAEQQIDAGEQALAVVLGEGQEFRFAATLPGAGGAVLRPSSGPATLVLQGLPHSPDKLYQVWALQGNQPVSLGVFNTDQSGHTVVTLDHDLQNVDAVAITLEPRPQGSRLPSGDPLLVAPLRG